ncbi:MAG: hypothetical protein ACFCUU_18175, partial [Cyclobacteriaceae bacterium]
MAEEFLPFVPLLITLCLALRLDTMSAIGIMVVGYGTGYGVAMINPFTVIIAQEIAGLQPASGIGYRLLLFVPFFLTGWWYVHRYAMRVRRDPNYSFMKAKPEVQPDYEYPQIAIRHKLVLLLTLGAVLLIVYGISTLSGWNWYLTELGAVFFGLALLVTL